MILEQIKELVSEKKIKWTAHCLKQLGERDISISDVKQCISSSEIIEDYPDDFPHPSCLIYGCTQAGRVLHTVVGCDGESVYIITAYRPNTITFEEDLKTRRSKR